LAIGWAIAGVAAAPGTAASDAAPPPAAAPAAQQPTDDVGEWSKTVTLRMIELRERLSGSSDVQKAQAQLESLEGRFDANLGDVVAHPGAASSMTEAAVLDAQGELDSISGALKDVSESLTRRATELEAFSKELTTTLKRAEAIRSDATQVMPIALRDRLDAVTIDGTSLLAIAQQRLNHAVSLQNRILVLEGRSASAQRDINDVAALRMRALVRLQQPPIWDLSFSDIARSTRGSTRFIGQALPVTLQFAKDNSTRVVLHAVIFLIGFALVTYLRRRFAAEDLGLAPSRAASRPIAASLMLIVLIAPILYPDAPSSVLQLIGLVMIVPMVRILELYLERALRPTLYALATLYIFDRVTIAFAREIVLQRVLLLVLSVTAIALLGWYLRIRLDKHLSLSPVMARAVRQLMMGGLVLSALSLVFNVLGNVDLALLLQSATVRGIALAAGLHAAALVLRDISRLLLASLRARGVRSVLIHEQLILSRTHRAAVVSGIAFWVLVMLQILRIQKPVLDLATKLFDAQWSIGQVTLSIGRLMAFVVAVWLALQVSRITQALLRDDVLPRFALPRGVPAAISTIANYAMVLIGLLIGASILGIGLSNLTLIVSALGVGIGFGLQNVVNNFVSGFILIFERSVQIGDTIQLADLQGKIVHIGLRASQLRTFSGSEVIIPNAELISNRLVNWTMSDRRRRYDVPIGVSRDSDPVHVHTVLSAILDGNPEILSDPKPSVALEGFGESAFNFRLYFWVDDIDTGGDAVHHINTDIVRVFAEEKIEIAYPQREIRVRPAPNA
jgi:small-conductance mechanosensitive channel